MRQETQPRVERSLLFPQEPGVPATRSVHIVIIPSTDSSPRGQGLKEKGGKEEKEVNTNERSTSCPVQSGGAVRAPHSCWSCSDSRGPGAMTVQLGLTRGTWPPVSNVRRQFAMIIYTHYYH